MIFNPNFDSCRFPGLEGDFVGYIFQKPKAEGIFLEHQKPRTYFLENQKLRAHREQMTNTELKTRIILRSHG